MLPAPVNALYVGARLLLVAGFAKALRVVPLVLASKRLGLDVINFNSGCDQADCSAVTTQRFGI